MAYLEIVHTNNSITTLQDFAVEQGIVLDSSFSLNDLFLYEGNDARIGAAYQNNPSQPASVSRLEVPTLIRVPQERLQKEYIAAAGNIVVPNTDFEAFFAEKIKQIIQNEGYKPISKNNKFSTNQEVTLRKIHNNVTIWCWCRLLGDDLEPGKLINLTPFVDSVSVNNSEHGGNFQISLMPIKAEFVDGEGWRSDSASLNEYFFQNASGFLSKVPFSRKSDKGQTVWQEYFFHNVISTNDVIFIQFEILDMEKNRISEETYKNLFISPRSLPGRNFDMIGLVDTNNISVTTANSAVSISIGGRDLMKLVLEDGCYFFPLDFASANGGFVNTGSNNPSFRRLVNGELAFFNAYVDRSIEFSLRFIFNLLSNIKVCDSRLFNYYEDKVFRYESASSDPTEQEKKSVGVFESDSQYKKVQVEGIWNIVNLVVDPAISGRRIVDSSISTDSGSLINFIQKVCQDPFVEFYGETFGDKYYFIARKHPFTGKAFKSYKKNGLVIDLTDDVVYNANLRMDDSEVYSWYRLTPRGNFFGDSRGISLLQFPAIFFPEYAEIWGSRPMSVVSNYIDYNYLSNSQNSVDLDYLTKQSTQDLAFIIESHACLPFTRTGTITILGDRRIKKGMFVRFVPTSEIFYVESVSQTWNFNEGGNDRQTTLVVSRGMVEEYMDTKNEYNYFNVVNLRKGKDGKSMDNNFKVNKDVFNFFNKRRQFAPNINQRNTRNLLS